MKNNNHSIALKHRLATCLLAAMTVAPMFFGFISFLNLYVSILICLSLMMSNEKYFKNLAAIIGAVIALFALSVPILKMIGAYALVPNLPFSFESIIINSICILFCSLLLPSKSIDFNKACLLMFILLIVSNLFMNMINVVGSPLAILGVPLFCLAAFTAIFLITAVVLFVGAHYSDKHGNHMPSGEQDRAQPARHVSQTNKTAPGQHHMLMPDRDDTDNESLINNQGNRP